MYIKQTCFTAHLQASVCIHRQSLGSCSSGIKGHGASGDRCCVGGEKRKGLLMLANGSAFMLLLLLQRWIPFSKRRFCAQILLSTIAVCFLSLSLDAATSRGCTFHPTEGEKKKKKTPTTTRRRQWLLIVRLITTWPAPFSLCRDTMERGGG